MAPKVIVSYDDTANDRDALALGKLLADAGAALSLAYVRHNQESEIAHERLEQREAEELLARGARSLGVDVARHVVLSASTGQGLWDLAEREGADIVLFGSDYRTPAGRVQPGTSARRLLDGGPVGLGFAPADLRDQESIEIERIGVIPDEGLGAAVQTASALASKLGASVARSIDEPIDLLVVESRPEAPEGRVMMSAAVEYAIENATCPVLVVPRNTPVRFDATAAPATSTSTTTTA
ncbi:MAG: universal stress protein [Actinobacteria bacterium]|nr:universal stress protein [Actinomycetota bacterium]